MTRGSGSSKSLKTNIDRGGGGIIHDMRRLGYEVRPKVVMDYFDETAIVHRVQRLNPYETRYYHPPTTTNHRRHRRIIEISDNEQYMRKLLNNSRYYKRRKREPFVTEECIPLHEWQTTLFPTCNLLHELDVGMKHVKWIAGGGYRDVWVFKEFDGVVKRVLKTLLYKLDYSESNYERHRRDALAYERLTPSNNVADIFGYCGNSGLFEYSQGGNINKAMKKNKLIEKVDRYQVAIQVARGIADVHTTEKEKQAFLAHTDINLDQFLLMDGIYKLNDFNRARFMRWNSKENRPCGFYVQSNKGKFRSPEEYRYDEEEEKVDVYSMGNIFYVLLTNEEPWNDMETEEAQERVMKGERPEVPDRIRESTDPVDIALWEAMKMCHIHNPKERASAREVLDYLISQLEMIGGTDFEN